MRLSAGAVTLVACLVLPITALAQDTVGEDESEPEVLTTSVSAPLPDRLSIGGSRMFYRPLADRQEDEVNLVFTGDTISHLGVSAAAARNGPPYDFLPMFTQVRHLIAGADLAICHLEVPLSPTSTDQSSFPLFNGPRELAEGLAYAGFDGCSTASNHSYDRGVEGVLGTISVLDDAGLRHAGTAASAMEEQRVVLYEIGDLTVGHVAATYWLNGLRMPDDKQWLVQLLNIDEIVAAAIRAERAGADLVVVSVHCCVEYQHEPTESQLEMAHLLIRSPFIDLVVTHHSHVIGPIESVGDEFIVHGLGNFLTGQRRPPRGDGVIVTASAVEVDGEWRIESIGVVPTEIAHGYRVRPAERGGPSFNRTMAAVNSMGAGIGEFIPRGLSPDELRLID